MSCVTGRSRSSTHMNKYQMLWIKSKFLTRKQADRVIEQAVKHSVVSVLCPDPMVSKETKLCRQSESLYRKAFRNRNKCVLSVVIKMDYPDIHNYHYICCLQGSFLEGRSAHFIWIINIKTPSAERTDCEPNSILKAGILW